ncbi:MULTISPECIES: nucleotidyl transferase AbiEii/AbiGii toxin family protein [Flavobacteriaceae]|uniref:nucleotidyl transferase AbiEii/AbiGii toxin family protein n=1 Tax=Flavobacteriaceae TaxID=49546 RepID=UPI001060CBC6|nr:MULTISPECIES: nucleotidyl transferase AbiEii/AbiGii toxin family protein [Flavobacteriaceae]TDN80333.1 putative nucleotidyltransferase component of viral defense system [Salegentibacter sp. 24]UAB83118.1 nucleotidyl transferase AbiEii/AbiGii toxin family protein [Zunongwangia sp. SCSIO 43204]
MNLHNYKTAFQGAIVATAQHFGISEIYVEKDYWVTLALKEIFTNKSTSQLAVFKGGTSLSKCFGIIERFSEDIDLVVIKEEGETDNSLKRKLKKVTGVLEPVMTVIPEHPLENKRGKIRKVVYGYDKVGVEGAFGQIRDHIVVEASSLGKSHPSEIVSVHSLIAAFIATTNNVDLINAYHLEPFKVTVLSIERTFCEKIISLIRFSYTEDPLEDLKDKVRHTYDLHQLLQQDKISSFLKSDVFEKMLLQVGKDDDKAIPNDKEWLLKHPSQSLFFSQTEMVWKSLGKTYSGSFRELLTGDLPEEGKVLKSMMRISVRLKEVKWEI